MNRFEVTARLVRDPDYARDKNGEPYVTKMGGRICKGSVADQHSKRAGDVSYFDFVIFGQLADTVVKQFKKGELINIVGWARNVAWTDKNGKRQTKMEIRVNEINPVFAKSKAAPKTGDEVPAWADDAESGLFDD